MRTCSVRLARVLLSISLLALQPLTATAQGEWVVKGDCTPELTDGGQTRGLARRLPSIRKDWDPTKVYKQMVILVSFRDVDFKAEDPLSFYDAMFNQSGFNMRSGKSCVADYFRDQSGGLFNMSFDVYGPIKVDTLACPYTNPNEKTRNYGNGQFRNALLELINQHPEIDFKQYDWDDDGTVEQVIFVHAGLCGNQGEGTYGYIWPNTGSFTTVMTPDGIKVGNFTASAEHWKGNLGYCGIGTVCHEFSHCLGLPDIYPTNNKDIYSVVDEWDLMDGGNFTNYGWSPPNYSALEKMLLGWLTPVELTEAASIRDMKPVDDGGPVYIIKNNESDYYLLENYQWKGWNLGVPGRGLVIFHVNYNGTRWSYNYVNNNTKLGYELVHADGLDYDGWDKLLIARGATAKYANKARMNSLYLSSSPFPWSSDSTETVNSALMGTYNEITNISMSADGLVSFDFRGGDLVSISPTHAGQKSTDAYFDLQGRKVAGRPGKGVYIRDGRKVIIH